MLLLLLCLLFLACTPNTLFKTDGLNVGRAWLDEQHRIRVDEISVACCMSRRARCGSMLKKLTSSERGDKTAPARMEGRNCWHSLGSVALASWSRCGSPLRAARELSLPWNFSSDKTRATSDEDSARKVIRFGYGVGRTVPNVYFTISRVSEAKHRRNTVWRYCIVHSRGTVDLLSTRAWCELCGIFFCLFVCF